MKETIRFSFECDAAQIRHWIAALHRTKQLADQFTDGKVKTMEGAAADAKEQGIALDDVQEAFAHQSTAKGN